MSDEATIALDLVLKDGRRGTLNIQGPKLEVENIAEWVRRIVAAGYDPLQMKGLVDSFGVVRDIDNLPKEVRDIVNAGYDLRYHDPIVRQRTKRAPRLFIVPTVDGSSGVKWKP